MTTMQFALHHVAESKQMVAKWDGVLVLFLQKNRHTRKQTKTPHKTNQKKKAQLLVTTVTGRMQEKKVMEQTLW